MNELLTNWSVVAAITVVAMMVSMLTIQLYTVTKRREEKHRYELEKAVLKSRSTKDKMIRQQIELLKDELEKISEDTEIDKKLDTSRKLLYLLEETIFGEK